MWRCPAVTVSFAVVAAVLMLMSCSVSQSQGAYCYQCYNVDQSESCNNVVPCDSGCVTECLQAGGKRHHYCLDNKPCTSGGVQHNCTGSLCNKDNPCHGQAPRCDVCAGDGCKVNSIPVQPCPVNSPYCMNTIKTDGRTGTRVVTKQCASQTDCQTKWLQASSKKSECINFDPATTHSFAVIDCTYCCIGDDCNRELYPKATLYKGKS